MEKRTLGRTGLEVTKVGFGSMELLYSPDDKRSRQVSDEQAERTLTAVLDAGINFIDTSPDYGLSEERIGRYISSRRTEYFLATKCGCNPEAGPGKHLWTRDRLLSNIETSLKRLQTDHVDILQLHNPERAGDAPMSILIETLQEIQSQGLIRFISISTAGAALLDYLKMGVFDTFQIPYSCLEPEHHDAITVVGQAGAGVIIRGGIGQGEPVSEDPQRVKTDVWEKAKLGELCNGIKPPEMILRFTLTHPHCHTTIVGTANPDHLTDNVAAAIKGPLPKELYEEIQRRVANTIAE